MASRSVVQCVECGRTYVRSTTDDGEEYIEGVSECTGCNGANFEEITAESLGMDTHQSESV